MSAEKTKITEEGQECRHCSWPVRRNERIGVPTKRTPSGYYFAWWFVCTNKHCRALYMVENAKRWFDSATAPSALVSAPNREPFQHGPEPGVTGDQLWPPWIPFEERIGEPHS